MKKILFVLHYPPPVHGAAMVGRYIRESERINSQFECRYINLGTSKTVEDIGKGGVTKLLRYLKIIGQTLKELVSFTPDLVYFTLTATGSGFYKDALLVLLVRATGKKVVYHFHNKGIKTRQHRWFDNMLYKVVFKNADVILLSEHLLGDIQKYVPENRVYYCPNGIPQARSSIDSLGKDQHNNSVQLLFLSNLIASKGVFLLLDACKKLQAVQLPFHCNFVGGEGDVSVMEFREKVRSLGLEDKVSYLGKKYGAEKEEEYLRTDIFVLPTHYPNECFPLVLLEAMMFALPVVSTYEGGIPGIVKDGVTGFLVPGRNVEILAQKLETLIRDGELRNRMGRNGRERYQENFTLEKFEHRFVGILDHCSQN